MQPAVTWTMASVGASIVGLGTLLEADVAGAVDGGDAHDTHACQMQSYLISEIQSRGD